MTRPGSVAMNVLAAARAAIAGSVRARPKSRIFGPAVARDEDVLGLQIAVDDALGVGSREPVGHVRGQLHGLSPGQQPAPDPRPQVLALQQLDHRNRLAVHHCELMDGHDVRMGDRRNGAGLVLESGAHLRIRREVVRQHLQRDIAAEPGITGTVDLAHATGADRLHDFELGEARTWGQTHESPLEGCVQIHSIVPPPQCGTRRNRPR